MLDGGPSIIGKSLSLSLSLSVCLSVYVLLANYDK